MDIEENGLEVRPLPPRPAFKRNAAETEYSRESAVVPDFVGEAHSIESRVLPLLSLGIRTAAETDHSQAR